MCKGGKREERSDGIGCVTNGAVRGEAKKPSTEEETEEGREKERD